jgi:peptidoglycan/xylan/chitin deacetylase (PgdA/CDA1 family)
MLRRHDLKVTFAVPAVLAHIYADQVRALVGDSHEVAAHGFKHEDISGLECADERDRIAPTTAIITEVTGRRRAKRARRTVRRWLRPWNS